MTDATIDIFLNNEPETQYVRVLSDGTDILVEFPEGDCHLMEGGFTYDGFVYVATRHRGRPEIAVIADRKRPPCAYIGACGADHFEVAA